MNCDRSRPKRLVLEPPTASPFVKPSAHDWDIAAADLILTEAGGALLDRAGKPPRYAGEVINHGALAAGSGELLGVLTGVIAGLDEG